VCESWGAIEFRNVCAEALHSANGRAGRTPCVSVALHRPLVTNGAHTATLADPPMTSPQKIQHRLAKPRESTSDIKFCNLFRQEMDGLYLLAFLLTANPETAEQCFISSLEECMGGVAVNEEWAHSWAKRVVIKNAIRLVAPHVHHSRSEVLPRFRQKECEPSEPSPDNRTLMSLHTLGDFERFVFVMTVLEQLSDRDAALLLGCLADEIRAARVRALQEIALGNAGRSRHTSSQTLPKQAHIPAVY
jgi:DNA-directed RNA polymerase specialized sigma24 family protein